MVASREVEILFFRGIGRQCERGFTALVWVIARNAILYLRKHIVPAAKPVGADLLEFAAPDFANDVIGRKKF